MRNKPADVLYCGVREETIKTANPTLNSEVLGYFHQFLTERYEIHLKKDIFGMPAPWTEDPILKSYRFTNIRREHDKETKWLIDNIINSSDICYEDKLLNCILFRLYNKHETSELIGMPIPFIDCKSKWNPEAYRELFEDALKQDPKRVFFTGAFITGGLKRALKWYLPKDDPKNSMEMRILWFMDVIIKHGIQEQIKSCKTQREVFDVLRAYDGLGDFLAYQIFVDFTYIEEFPFSENEFTAAGPGCKMGLKFLFDDTDAMTPEECLFWLRDQINAGKLFKQIGKKVGLEALFRDLPKYDRKMNVMSLENCMCELSKYTRAMRGEGRPRKTYKPQGGTK